MNNLSPNGWSGYLRSLYAALVAPSDLKLAEKLLAENNYADSESDLSEARRAYGRVAFACCRQHPAATLRLLSQLNKQSENSTTLFNYHIKIVEKMAVEQTETARRLAESIDEPNQRVWALGLMADRLNSTEPKLAKRILADATKVLESTDQSNSKISWLQPEQTLTGLLPIAQQVDPGKVRGMIWLAVYKTIPRSRWSSGVSNRTKLKIVAGSIARYDRKLALAILGSNNLNIPLGPANEANLQVLLAPEKLMDYTTRACDWNAEVQNTRTLQKLTEMLNQSEVEFWRTVSQPSGLEWPTEKFETSF